ncbi:MAG: ATP-binding cassette domain-containing protein [Bacteroidales bacterium]|nr:ATP-binding cassette domain-containing protein [Bacteroidales bacterium]
MNKNASEVIHFENAAISNGEDVVIRDLNMSAKAGELLYLTGRVGSGKSSIVNTIIAETPLEEGKGIICGYDLSTIGRRDIPLLRRKMGVVFQDFRLLMNKTVHENLEFVLRATGWKERERIEERIESVLKEVGMEGFADKHPHRLSGGEQQRVCIARAILNDPVLIIADEPTGNLDNETAEKIMELIKKVNDEDTAVLMVTHRSAIVDNYPGRVFHCGEGKCVEMQ